MPINYVQTVLDDTEMEQLNIYLAKARIRNKREWIRELIMKEVKNGGNALRLHERISESEDVAGGASDE